MSSPTVRTAFTPWEGGIAYQIKTKYPAAYEADCKTKRGSLKKMGTFSSAPVVRDDGSIFEIVNLYTQFRPGKARDSKIQEHRYEAIKESLRMLKRVSRSRDRIGLPKLGAGLAGGDWERIARIIEDVIPEATIVEYSEDPSK